MWTWWFWRQALERAVKTFAGTASSLLSGDGLNIVSINWLGILQLSAIASLISVLLSVASSQVGDGSPSVVNTERPAEDAAPRRGASV